jgi:acyl-CoA reductase-like NAD-dependent aldehyde dehydrogenase
MVEPTLLENVPREQPLVAEEAFGPVAVLQEFATFEEALWQVNDSKFGLQAGVFTRDIDRMHQAWDTLEVGGVIIGDVPSFRADPMPYGGVKESGLGREGIRFAMEDMSEIRMLVVR